MSPPSSPDTRPLPPAPALATPELSAESPESAAAAAARRALRKPSPGLLARMKLLDLHHKKNRLQQSKEDVEIGRIPEDQLRQLDLLHQQERSLRVERRGRAWSGPRAPRLTTQSTGGSDRSPMDGPLAAHESDHSSIISVSDRMVPSDYDDSEVDVLETDTLKYRLPEIGKSRGSSISMSRGATEAEPSPDDSRPPTPPPKDSPPVDNTPELPPEPVQEPESLDEIQEEQEEYEESYFNPNPHGLSRAASIYTLSRVSFTNQIQQLTSIKLPEASSLQASISAIPTSKAASSALNDAAGQIRVWMSKASDVLNGLDAEDDVDWASAAGREGLDEVDAAINTFETLIRVFVGAIEELQTRPDIGSLSMSDLTRLVEQMENILNDWAGIKNKLRGVKEQVEIAMEWEELWNTVLGDISLEVEALGRLVFEMEERRHRSVMAECIIENGNGLDIESLETIVEETPPNNKRISHSRFSLPSAFTEKSSPLANPGTAQDDSNLLALFARMQPLRASLDFLPMRLAQFQMRAQSVFPTACDELEHRRASLEDKWRRLERDAESLRRELGEDRWVLVFRNAGRQAAKMCESVRRSVTKLREALEDREHITNLPATAKKIESFEAKRMHYGPAIERVLMIIDKGVKDRLTVNGEILRLQSDMRREWAGLEDEMREMQERVEGLNMKDSEQLRDSISTILSTERSFASSVDTPGSSPASSVVVLSRKDNERFKSRQSSFNSNKSAPSNNRRFSSIPAPSSAPRKPPLSFSRAEEKTPSNPRYSMATPTPPIRRAAPTPPPSNKPRWNGSVNTKDTVIGHNFKPLSLTTPSPYSKDTAPKPRGLHRVASHSNLPRPSPSRQAGPSSPPTASSIPRPASTTPAPNKRSSVIAPRTPSRNALSRLDTRTVSSSAVPSSTAANRRRSAFLERSTPGGDDALTDAGYSDASSPISMRKSPRAASAMALRRTSMLPQPRTPRASNERPSLDVPRPSLDGGRSSRADSRAGSRAGGRLSSFGIRGASRQGDRKDDNKPRWKF